ncbi:GAF and ANTAR domain-containing protein [Mycobacterium cookii]|uniref:GAF and ANTAR domain-containing protein n=1 Tax=Nocardioides furvisabuli TaxID=375542 RepID=A0ABN2X9W7_9ACTN|nr:GAF and ANTAR domain-containing protein [Nocardioides furvisabuli]
MSGEKTSATEFADLAQAMGAADADHDRLTIAVEAAVELVGPCAHAGVTFNRRGECLTLAGSSEVPELVNKLQNESGEGPCHVLDRDEETIISTDLPRDQRWPTWGARVHEELGLRSSMSLLIFTARGSYGTLSLYAERARAFQADDLATAQALAGHLAVSMAASREIMGLGVALASRTVIGQAEGIVMERLGVDADQALSYLKRVSSHTNTKLVDVALGLVRTRRLPDAQS